MIATTIGLSIRIWIGSGSPDNDVHTASGTYPDTGELFMNSVNGALYVCTQTGVAVQTWQTTTNTALVQSIISSNVLQADWSQNNSSSQDFIKNKPVLANVATTGSYLDLNNRPSLATVATSGSYTDLSNKPTIPSAQIQSDWTQINTASLDYIKNKPTLSTVATTGAYSDLSGKPSLSTVAITGSYTDLTNKPSIPSAQIQSDWTQANNTSVDYIKNKPNLSAVAISGLYTDIIGRPTLSTVATSGSYNDLTNKPTIPSSQIQSDWTQSNSTSLDFIKNKPVLSAVAISGAYNDLSGRPILSTVAITGAYGDLTGRPTLSTVATTGAYADLTGKPSLSTVATSGSYTDLLNRPTIPAAQIQSDWNQSDTAALDYIKNKPVTASRSQTSTTRALNTPFQVSTTRWSTVRYSVDISTTVSLTGSQVGRVVLEIASDAAFTSNVQQLQSGGNGNTGTLVVGLVLTQLSTACLSGDVPPGYYVRLRTVNTTGTPTYTYQTGQEVLL